LRKPDLSTPVAAPAAPIEVNQSQVSTPDLSQVGYGSKILGGIIATASMGSLLL